MTRLIPLCLLALGCSTAPIMSDLSRSDDAPEVTAEVSNADARVPAHPMIYKPSSSSSSCSAGDAALTGEDWVNLAYDGAQGTTRTLAVISDFIAELDAPARADLRDAAAVLATNCPYNRASFQLPITLYLVANRHPAQDLPNTIRLEWARIQEGLALHVEVLEQIGAADLPMPGPEAHLADVEVSLASRSDLERADDPMAHTEALVGEIYGIVNAYPEPVQARIDAAWETVSTHTRQEWTLKLQLLGWRDALISLEPQVQDPAMKADVERMIAALDEYMSLYC